MNQPYDNSGVLFVNENKEKENQPDYTGNIVVNGQKLRLAGWKKTSKSDPSKTFLSVAVSEYQTQQSQTQASTQTQSNENLPF